MTTAIGHVGRALAHTGVITRRNLLANVRLPDVLILSTVQPVVFMLMFLDVFGGAIQAALPPAAQGDYVYWLLPGILAQSAVFGSAPTAYGLNNDSTTGVLDRFRSLPMARCAVLAGRALSDLIRSTFILSLQLAVGVVLGFRWQNGLTGLLAAIAVALAFGYACSWLMAYIGLMIRNSEAIQAAVYRLPDDPDQLGVPAHPDHARLAAILRRTPTHHQHRQRAARTHPRPRRPTRRAHRHRRDDAGTDLDRGHPRRFRPLGGNAYRRNNNLSCQCSPQGHPGAAAGEPGTARSHPRPSRHPKRSGPLGHDVLKLAAVRTALPISRRGSPTSPRRLNLSCCAKLT
jgi:hypothetical protein